MKLATWYWVVALSNLLLVSQGAEAQTPAPLQSATPASGTSGPRIRFAETQHDFGIVALGDTVKHAFVFTNIGDQVLEITNVHPACGCTTAGQWTRRVEPGQTGVVPVSFNSSEFNGPVEKTVEVWTTDKSQRLITLYIKCSVWTPIEVSPQFVFLNYMPESATNAWTTVSIINNLETPLTLETPQWEPQRGLNVELKTKEPGRSYELFVAAKPPLTRNVNAQITIKTSSTNMPVVRLTAMVHVQPVMVYNPRQVVLPAPPLANAQTNAIRIDNVGTNHVALLEPSVNDTNVNVQIQEVVPGSTYLAKLIFPEGFSLPPGQPLNFSVKTTHPLFPQIRVPILQMARPAGQAVAPATKPAAPAEAAAKAQSPPPR